MTTLRINDSSIGENEIMLTARDDLPQLNSKYWPVRIGSYNHPTISECIDEVLDKTEWYYVDPELIDWTPFDLTDVQRERIIAQHAWINDVLTTIVAIETINPGFAFNSDEDVVEFCKNHGINMGTAKPSNIREWQSVADDFMDEK